VKVGVDRGLCEGHGQCNMIDDQLFTLDDEGYSDIGTGRPVPDDLEDNADQGIYNCPVNALFIEKD
jgi:ferredoxin